MTQTRVRSGLERRQIKNSLVDRQTISDDKTSEPQSITVPPEIGDKDMEGICTARFGGCLTEKERNVLVYLSKGCTIKEVASLVGVSRHTIDSHVRHIYQKLGVHTRAEAISEAFQLGIIWQSD